MSDTDIAAIADGLSEAQRRAMAKVPSNSPNWLARAPQRTVTSLHAKGLVDWDDNPSRLTSLGIAVRAHLEASQ